MIKTRVTYDDLLLGMKNLFAIICSVTIDLNCLKLLACTLLINQRRSRLTDALMRQRLIVVKSKICRDYLAKRAANRVDTLLDICRTRSK